MADRNEVNRLTKEALRYNLKQRANVVGIYTISIKDVEIHRFYFTYLLETRSRATPQRITSYLVHTRAKFLRGQRPYLTPNERAVLKEQARLLGAVPIFATMDLTKNKMYVRYVDLLTHRRRYLFC